MISINSRQRAYLKSAAMTMDAIFQVGKSGITPELTKAVDEALEARELIKLNMLKSCPDDPKTAAVTLSERTRSLVVQVIGRKVVLFRQAKEKSRFELKSL